MDKAALFQAILDDDPTWREQVNDNWDCLDTDDKDLVEILAQETTV